MGGRPRKQVTWGSSGEVPGGIWSRLPGDLARGRLPGGGPGGGRSCLGSPGGRLPGGSPGEQVTWRGVLGVAGYLGGSQGEQVTWGGSWEGAC